MNGWTRPDFIVAGRAWAEGHNTLWIARALERNEAEVWGRLREIRDISRAFLGATPERKPQEEKHGQQRN